MGPQIKNGLEPLFYMEILNVKNILNNVAWAFLKGDIAWVIF